MARKKQPEGNGNEELFIALKLLEKEKGISVDFMLDKIRKAIGTACKNNYGNEDVTMEIEPEKGVFHVFLNKTAVEEVENPDREIDIDSAKKYSPLAHEGDLVGIPLDTKQFGRVAAQTARNIIRQGIRDSERDQMLQEFKDKNQELVSGLVERIDPRTGVLTLKIGKAEAVLPRNEQIGGENAKEGDYLKVYVVDVKETEKGPRAIISRTHPDMVKRMFETEVPEIFDGTVEIKAVAREAGSRTKLAVLSHDPEVDPVGACIGARGTRVSEIVDELGGEKIDIVEYSDDPGEFVAAALSPADVKSVVTAGDGQRSCRATVPDSQLSLAIGNKGQNARLAAKLTGWKIDIKPESAAVEDFAAAKESEKSQETAETEEIKEETAVTDDTLIEEDASAAEEIPESKEAQTEEISEGAVTADPDEASENEEAAEDAQAEEITENSEITEESL